MPGGHGVGDALHRDPDVERLADRDVARVLVVVGMAEVQEAAGDDRRRAVGRDVAQPRGDERARPVGADPQRHDRLPEHLEALRDRRGVERQRARVVAALVDRDVGGVAVRAPGARVEPDGLRARVDERCVARRLGGEALGVEDERQRRLVAAGPRGLGDPPPGSLVVIRCRRDGLLHPRPEHRLVHDPGVAALEVLVPPADALLQEADLRSGSPDLGPHVPPRPDEPLARARRGSPAAGRPRRRTRRPTRTPRGPAPRCPRSARPRSRGASSRRGAGGAATAR